MTHKEKNPLWNIIFVNYVNTKGLLCMMNIALVHIPAVIFLPFFLSKEAGIFVMLWDVRLKSLKDNIMIWFHKLICV